MPDCFKETYRHKDNSSDESFGCIAREQLHEHSQEHSQRRGHGHGHVHRQMGQHHDTASEHLPDLSIFSEHDAVSPVDSSPVLPDTSDHAQPTVVPKVSDLTQLSEQLLPVHANGSYPSVADWEGLHSSNVQKASDASQNGSNLEFFGDSITEAMGYNPAAMQPFNEAFGDTKPAVFGLGGDGTAQLLYRLNHGEMQGQPKTAVLMIGTNDLGRLSASQIAQNTEKSIESIKLRSPGTKVVVMGILPRPDDGDPGNSMVDDANSALSQLATADGAVQFVNLRNSFVDANGAERPDLYQSDKLHLSAAGYQAWADGLKAALQSSGSDNSAGYVPPDSGSGADFNPLDTDSSNGLALDTAGIRGVNLSGAEWGKNSSQDSQFWPTAQELDYYKSKGMNTVRLAISWEQFQPTLNGSLDPSEMARLDNFLHEADARGMKVLLNLANFDRYTLNHGPNGQGVDGETAGTVVGSPGLPISAMQDFWSRMVQHVDADPSASRAIAGWDLTNEPFNTNGSWPETATAVDQAIRATGDNHTVVVEGDQWARDFSGLEGRIKMLLSRRTVTGTMARARIQIQIRLRTIRTSELTTSAHL